MIAFKDFAPRILEKAGVLSRPKFASLQETVKEASKWCADARVTPLNVETVVLPDIQSPWEEGSTDPHLTTGKDTQWHQVVRVWYLAK